MNLIASSLWVLMSIFSSKACEWKGDGTSAAVDAVWKKKHASIQYINWPRNNHQKRCSDMDTVFDVCKEQSGSIEEAHQRTVLAYSRRLGGIHD